MVYSAENSFVLKFSAKSREQKMPGCEKMLTANINALVTHISYLNTE